MAIASYPKTHAESLRQRAQTDERSRAHFLAQAERLEKEERLEDRRMMRRTKREMRWVVMG